MAFALLDIYYPNLIKLEKTSLVSHRLITEVYYLMARWYQKDLEAYPLCFQKCSGEIRPARYCAVTDCIDMAKKRCFYCNVHAKYPYLTGWKSSALSQTKREYGRYWNTSAFGHSSLQRPSGTKSSPKNQASSPDIVMTSGDDCPMYKFFDDLSAFNAQQAEGWPGYDESRFAPN